MSNLRAEGVLVVVAGDLPAVADDLEEVGLAVAVRVLDARDVAALHAVEPAVALGQAEHLVQAAGEARELDVLGIVGAAACRSARFRRGAWRPRACRRAASRAPPASSTTLLGHRKADELVVVVLGGRLSLLGRAATATTQQPEREAVRTVADVQCGRMRYQSYVSSNLRFVAVEHDRHEQFRLPACCADDAACRRLDVQRPAAVDLERAVAGVFDLVGRRRRGTTDWPAACRR